MFGVGCDCDCGVYQRCEPSLEDHIQQVSARVLKEIAELRRANESLQHVIDQRDLTIEHMEKRMDENVSARAVDEAERKAEYYKEINDGLREQISNLVQERKTMKAKLTLIELEERKRGGQIA